MARVRRIGAALVPTDAQLAKSGCSLQEYRRMQDIGDGMRLLGATKRQTPLGRYTSQRRDAGRRGIEWKITLIEWWHVWVSSGHWAERGPGQGYVMCRFGDTGPYAANNVYIATNPQNARDAARKDDLPMGVYRQHNGFRAKRSLGGRCYELGLFQTISEADRAYQEFQSPPAASGGV